jgi:Ser/Thr protein kinase RdoA (MazF antagonist)
VVYNINEIVSHFRINGNFVSATPIGSGHINDSFLVITEPESEDDYVLQRINHMIFKDVPGLMNNIVIVTRHIASMSMSGDPLIQGLSHLTLIPTNDLQSYFKDADGNFWRMYSFIAGTRSYDVVENSLQAFEGGKALGIFQYLTADIPAENLSVTIPDFHDINKRLETFRNTVKQDPVSRVNNVIREISFIEERAEEMKTILKLGESGKIPLRVTHNDTKFNNILFDENGKAVCIVDLDTVMPGYVLYDFGDAIRTGANSCAEDEEDLSKVHIDLNLFEAYIKGYLSFASGFLNETEKEHLAFSAKFMTYIIGLRFLTDHIDGDHYFRIHFEKHNLQRARAQFRLLESMEENFSRMKDIVRLYR